MLQFLDSLFPMDISDIIGGFLSESFLCLETNKRRVFYEKTDSMGLPIPKKSFRQAVWMRRYKNPYMPEGAKIMAFSHVSLPSKRIPHILSRSFLKIRFRVHCNCTGLLSRQHLLQHWLEGLLKVVKAPDPEEFTLHGWDLSIPFMLLTFEHYLDPIGLTKQRFLELYEDYPCLDWKKAEMYHNNSIYSGETYPMYSVLSRCMNNINPL